MAAIITPDSSAVTVEYNSVAWNVLTGLGFFAKVFMTDMVSVPGDHPNAFHKNTLPGVTLGNVHKNMFFFIWAGNLT